MTIAALVVQDYEARLRRLELSYRELNGENLRLQAELKAGAVHKEKTRELILRLGQEVREARRGRDAAEQEAKLLKDRLHSIDEVRGLDAQHAAFVSAASAASVAGPETLPAAALPFGNDLPLPFVQGTAHQVTSGSSHRVHLARARSAPAPRSEQRFASLPVHAGTHTHPTWVPERHHATVQTVGLESAVGNDQDVVQARRLPSLLLDHHHSAVQEDPWGVEETSRSISPPPGLAQPARKESGEGTKPGPALVWSGGAQSSSHVALLESTGTIAQCTPDSADSALELPCSWGSAAHRVYRLPLLLAHRELALRISHGAPGLPSPDEQGPCQPSAACPMLLRAVARCQARRNLLRRRCVHPNRNRRAKSHPPNKQDLGCPVPVETPAV